jgi:hypothetical protein
MLSEARGAARELLGYPDRMISSSKTGYRDAHPDHAAIFNANVCLLDGKIWHGDLDLTLDEPRLLALAERLGRGLFVLYESDGRFEHEEKPLLNQAVYRCFPGGASIFDDGLFTRDDAGTLRRLPPPPPSPPHLVEPYDWNGSRRWRLLRFWKLHAVTNRDDAPHARLNRLVYVGKRGGRRSPLLIFGFFRSRGEQQAISFEITWYPSSRPHMSAPSPRLERSLQIRGIEIRVGILRWPGYMHEAWLTFERSGR